MNQPDHLCNLCGHSCYLLKDTDSTGFTIFRKSDRSGVDISVEIEKYE